MSKAIRKPKPLSRKRLFAELAAMFEEEVLACNKSASTVSPALMAGFLSSGAVCKRMADRLRAAK